MDKEQVLGHTTAKTDIWHTRILFHLALDNGGGSESCDLLKGTSEETSGASPTTSMLFDHDRIPSLETLGLIPLSCQPMTGVVGFSCD